MTNPKLQDAKLTIRILQAENRLLRTIVADQREQIEHLLDQPLVILNGEAYIGVRETGPIYSN
jgi:hypothetical protein